MRKVLVFDKRIDLHSSVQIGNWSVFHFSLYILIFEFRPEDKNFAGLVFFWTTLLIHTLVVHSMYIKSIFITANSFVYKMSLLHLRYMRSIRHSKSYAVNRNFVVCAHRVTALLCTDAIVQKQTAQMILNLSRSACSIDSIDM